MVRFEPTRAQGSVAVTAPSGEEKSRTGMIIGIGVGGAAVAVLVGVAIAKSRK